MRGLFFSAFRGLNRKPCGGIAVDAFFGLFLPRKSDAQVPRLRPYRCYLAPLLRD